MAHLLGTSSRAGDVEDVAQRYLYERAMSYEVLARPRLASAFPWPGSSTCGAPSTGAGECC